MKKNQKKLALFIAVMILTLSIAQTSFAANAVLNLKATYRNIRVFRNGVQASFSKEPFIVDGTTYVPLRDMSEILDKVVTWDNATSTISIQDKPGQSTQELYNQILTQQQTISQLEAKLKNVEEKKVEEISIKDLRKQLIDDYDRIDKNKNLQIEDIKLSERKGDIEIEIYLDLEKDAAFKAWEDLSDKKITSFLQDIVDDILEIEQYEDADIEGFIEDKYDDKELVSFTIDKKGNVVLD